MTGLVYDPRDRATIDDPLPILRRLQEEDPVHWSEILRGWVITRHEDVRRIQLGTKLSADRLTPFFESLASPQQDAIRDLIRYLNTWVAFKDPPEHGRLRSILNKVLTVRDVEELRPQIVAAVDHLLTRVAKLKEFDFIQDFAFPLPATVIMFLCGLPSGDVDLMKTWSEKLKPFIGSATNSPDKYDLAQQGARDMATYFREVIHERRLNDGHDIISKLLRKPSSGIALTDDEIVGTCMLFLFGGHETTTNLIGNGMRTLLKFPEARDRLAKFPEGIVGVIEEILRYDGPTGGLVRVVKIAHTLHGKSLEVGQRVFLMVHAANHDPRVFPDPEKFDPTRTPNPHLTFNFGPHFCLGAPLARLEGQIALQSVVQRLPNLRLTAPVQYMDTMVMRGVMKMPCELVLSQNTRLSQR
jgi:cytochrome P450